MKKKFTLLFFLLCASVSYIYAQCDYTLVLEDSYGDGWNGGSVSLLVNSELIYEDITINSGSGPISYTFEIIDGDDISINYTAGSWSSENEIYIYDSEGILTYSDGVNGTIPTGGNLVATCPTCYSVTNLVADNITPFEATVSWDQNETVEYYTIQYGEKGFTLGQGTIIDNLTTNSYTIANLTKDTSYDVFVRTQCSESENSKWRPLSFTTLPTCYTPSINQFTNITTEGFDISWIENGSATEWEIEISETSSGFTDEPTITMISSTETTLTGLDPYTTYYIKVRSKCDENDYSSWSSYQYISTLPTCPIPSISSYDLDIESTVIHINENSEFSEWEIEVSETSNGFTGIPTYSNITSTSYEIIGLSPYTFYYVKIRAVCSDTDSSPWSGYSIFRTLPTCMPPEILSFDNDIESTIIQISENSETTEWEIEVSETSNGFTGNPTYSSISNTSYEITGLSPYTYYYIKVRAVCSDTDSSPWSNYHVFRTLPSCTPPGISSFSNEIESTVIQINENGEATEWEIEVSETSNGFTGNPTYSNITNTSYEITGLSPYTYYYVKVRAVCSDTDSSPWSGYYGFKTLPSCTIPGISYFTNDIESTVLHINENGDANEWEIEVSETNNGFTGTPTHSNITATSYEITGLTPYTQYYVKIRSVCSDTDSSPWSGYDIFRTLPSCLVPGISYFTNDIESTVLHINENGDANEWEIEVSETNNGFTGTPTHSNITNTSYEITELAPYTQYYVKIRAVCSDTDSSPWSGYYSFKTLSTCAIPGFSYFDNDIESTILHINENGDATEWEIEVSETNNGFTGTPTHSNITNTSYEITELDPYTQYYVKIRAVCSDTDSSPWSGYYSFTTLPTCAIPEISYFDNDIESTVLHINESGDATEWEIEVSETNDGFTGTPTYSNITNTSFEIDRLTANTTYYLKIRSICSDTDNSPWSSYTSFTTKIDVQTNPVTCHSNYPIISNQCIEIPINITEDGILGTDFYLKEVRFIIEHTYDGDLSISLTSPNDIETPLSNRRGGNSDNYGDPNNCSLYTSFSMTGENGSIFNGNAPYIGSYIPEGDFDEFNSSNTKGVWTLKICDMASGDEGFLSYAELVFETLLPNAIENNSINVLQVESYPNPAKTFINLNIKNIDIKEDLSIDLYDAVGNVKYQKSFSKGNNELRETIPTDKFADGVYFLIVKNGETYQNQKIIIKK